MRPASGGAASASRFHHIFFRGLDFNFFHQNLHRALESLGLKVKYDRLNFRRENCYKLKVMEQEVIDMTNAIARDGLVYFPDFCSVVLMKFRFLTTFVNL